MIEKSARAGSAGTPSRSSQAVASLVISSGGASWTRPTQCLQNSGRRSVTEQLAPQYHSQAIRTDAEHALAVGDHPPSLVRCARYFLIIGSFMSGPSVIRCWPSVPPRHGRSISATAAQSAPAVDTRTSLIIRLCRCTFAAFWEPVIKAELEDTAEAWRFALDELARAAGTGAFAAAVPDFRLGPAPRCGPGANRSASASWLTRRLRRSPSARPCWPTGSPRCLSGPVSWSLRLRMRVRLPG